jgi:phosphate transport system permease protein
VSADVTIEGRAERPELVDGPPTGGNGSSGWSPPPSSGRVPPVGGTTGPVPPARRGRRPHEFTPADVGTVAGSLVSAASFAWLLFARLTDGTGWMGFVVVTYLVFLVAYAVVSTDRLGWLVAKDRLATMVVYTGTIILLIPMLWLVGYVIVRGVQALRPAFLVRDLTGVSPIMPSTAGGGLHAVIGTLQQVFLALLLSLPLGLAAAVFLNETRSRFRRPVRIVVDAMSGLPSIVCGLFVYATLILPYATSGIAVFSFSGFMAALALSMIMLPTVTRTVDVVLRLVADGLREASLALGASRARTVWSVVFPTARTGIATAVVLGVARIVGETAPLLFTAFGLNTINANPFVGSQESLPLFVYRSIKQPNQNVVDRGFAGALVLMIVVLVLFALARFIGRDRSRARRRRLPFRRLRQRRNP